MTASFSAAPGWKSAICRADGWSAFYGGPHNDGAYSIQQTSDGGYIVAGDTESFGAGDEDIWVLKLGPDGTVEWQKTYGGGDLDRAYSIQQTGDGGYIVTGETNSFGAGKDDIGVKKEDIWVLKLRPDGDVEWQKTYGGSNVDQPYSIQQTGDGGYIVAGYTESFGAGVADLWVLKLRPDGSVEWQKTYGGDDQDWGYSIRQTGDGGYVVTGGTWSFGAGNVDFWVLKLRPDGTVEWQKTYGGVDSDRPFSIQQTGDGGYIVAGETWSFYAGEGDAWVLKLEPDGTVEWQKTYGGGSYDNTHFIRQTDDGGYIAAGYTASFGAELPDLWVLKLRPDGSITPSCYIMFDTGVSGKDSSATVKTAAVSVRDSNASPQDSSATAHDTNAPTHILCPSTAAE